MVYSTIEWFALFLAVLILVKLTVISFNAKSWMRFSKSLFVKPWLTTSVSLILALVVLYYLLAAGITIVQIFAVMLFLTLLMVSSMTHVAKDLYKTVGKNLQGKIKDMWLSIIIWAILSIWVLVSLFT